MVLSVPTQFQVTLMDVNFASIKSLNETIQTIFQSWAKVNKNPSKLEDLNKDLNKDLNVDLNINLNDIELF